MPETSGGEKSLPASARKKQKAREEGNIAKSQDLNAAWTLAMSLLVLAFLGTRMLMQMVDATWFYFGHASSIEVSLATAPAIASQMLARVGMLVLPFMVFMMAAGLAVNVMQTGFLITSGPLKPKFDKINPFTGWQKFANKRSATELLKSCLKLSITGVVVVLTLRSRWAEVMQLPYLTPAVVVSSVAGVIFTVWLRIVIVMLVLGILDYGLQWWMHEQDLRMTVQEAKEEAKELEGDPQIRRRIREVQRRMAYQRMMAEVPTADVVVTNPIRFAVALRYDMNNMDAPVVIAKGARLVAARIRAIAEENSVPIVEKPELARALFKTIDVGQTVPEGLFRAVAEVLAFVYQVDRREEKLRERQNALQPVGQTAT